MKIFQAYSCNSNTSQLNFYKLYLGYLNLKKNNNQITMYCNKHAYELIIKYIPYDEVILMENKYDDPLLYKLSVIEDINEDFIYIDPELLLFDDNLFNKIDIKNNDLVVEYLNPKEYFGPDFFVKKNKKILNKEEICDYKNYDGKYFSTNIIGMTLDFKDKYLLIVEKIKNLFFINKIEGNYDFGYYSLILEELAIYLTQLKYNSKYNQIIPFDDIINLGISECANKYNFTYLFNNVTINTVKLLKTKILKNHTYDFNVIENFEKINNIIINIDINIFDISKFQAKKIQLVQDILNCNNEKIISEIENIIKKV